MMRRVVVIGASGAGKTTLAMRLAERLGVPHVELDALYWGPNWTGATTEVMKSRVQLALAGDAWIVSGNFGIVRDSVWPRADTLIWLDYAMPVVMWRVVWRTIHRCATREPLFGRNVETWRLSFFSTESVIAWAWRTWRGQRRDFPKLFRSPAYAGICKLRFQSPRETEDWIACVNEGAYAENC
jgi:adenylate kinase family enzyme